MFFVAIALAPEIVLDRAIGDRMVSGPSVSFVIRAGVEQKAISEGVIVKFGGLLQMRIDFLSTTFTSIRSATARYFDYIVARSSKTRRIMPSLSHRCYELVFSVTFLDCICLLLACLLRDCIGPTQYDLHLGR